MLKIMLAFILFASSGFAEGVDFIKQDWDKALDEAEKTGKPIFVDAYTDWCGWCKVMDQKTFSDKSIYSYMNKHFVNAKINMEKGIGVKLAMKYQVTGFPSYLIFNNSGRLVYKTLGFMEPKDFIDVLKMILKKTENPPYKGYSASFDIDYPQFYLDAFKKSGKRSFPEDKEIAEYFKTQDELFSEKNWAVINRFDTPEDVNKFFLENMDKYKELYCESDVDRKFGKILNKKTQNAIKQNDEEKLAEIGNFIDKYKKEDREYIKRNIRINFYKETENWNKYFENVADHIKNLNPEDNHYQMNNYCWEIYENIDDPDHLNFAKNTMKKVCEVKQTFAYTDTYAALLYKTGNYSEAKQYAEKAIKLSKKENRNPESTKKLLKKINEKL